MIRDVEAATIARVVREAGVPLSSLYHYFGSKDGVLLAVMERGAERFFSDLPEPDGRTGRPADHLRMVVATAVQALGRHPHFVRLLVAFAVQPSGAGDGRVDAEVGRVRDVALTRLRKQIAFQDDPDSATADQLARFALAALDGAFVASQSDRGVALQRVLEPLVASLVAAATRTRAAWRVVSVGRLQGPWRGRHRWAGQGKELLAAERHARMA